LTTEIVWGLATDRSQVQASASAGRVDPQKLGRPTISRRAQASIPAAASAISRRTRTGARGCRSLFFLCLDRSEQDAQCRTLPITRAQAAGAGRCRERHEARSFLYFFFSSLSIESGQAWEYRSDRLRELAPGVGNNRGDSTRVAICFLFLFSERIW
jgi:hypothetical protein